MEAINKILLTMLTLSSLSLLVGIILLMKNDPYSKFLSTIHKLSSFFAGVLFGIIVLTNFLTFGTTNYPLILAIITIVVFIVSVTSGSILISIEVVNQKIKLVHKFSSILTYLFGFITFYLLSII